MKPTSKLGLSFLLASIWIGVVILLYDASKETLDQFRLFDLHPVWIMLAVWVVGVLFFHTSRD